MLYAFLIGYAGTLVALSVCACIYLFCNSQARAPLKEIADYTWCPFWEEIQDDMGLITEYNLYYNGAPRVSFTKAPLRILDIGSGNGVTSAMILRSVFGRKVAITLSDIHPNLSSWSRLSNVEYSATPINIESDSLSGYSMLSLLNSLHHLNEATVTTLFKKARQAGSSIFIMDAKRLPPYHPLLVPFLYYWIYVFLTIAGLFRRASLCKIRSLGQILVVPWIMCVDQMIGSTRRYPMDSIRKFAEKHSFSVLLREDSLMNYIILEPRDDRF